MRVDVWSDVICPWCAIGHRRFAAGLDLFEAAGGDRASLTVVPRAFQLDPTAPLRPTPMPEVYAAKFGGPQRAAQLIAGITEAAAEAGWEFHLDRALRANTFDAHRLIALAGTLGEAGSTGRALEVEARLMRAYFTDGRDVADVAVLLECAGSVGMEPAEVAAALESGGGSAHVEADLAEASERGITAVPTFVFDPDGAEGGFALPGAQDPQLFARVLSKMAGGVGPPS